MKILLDTSVYSQPIKKRPLPAVIAHWKEHPERDYAVSAICELEVLYGVYAAGSTSLSFAYEKILKGRFPVLPFDAVCATRYAQLQAEFVKNGNTRPTFDLMIAATALVHGLTLATCNATDFQGIEGLRVADWSTAPKDL
jgi:predicted nucleic acid-binding protein